MIMVVIKTCYRAQAQNRVWLRVRLRLGEEPVHAPLRSACTASSPSLSQTLFCAWPGTTTIASAARRRSALVPKKTGSSVNVGT